MAPKPASTAAREISTDSFNDLLGQYPSLLQGISESKGASKDGQSTLQELDDYRYVEAPRTFRITDGPREMGLNDIERLVEWKLRHGKFRPTLMKLVKSNDATLASDTVKEALDAYRDGKDVQAALGVLTRLKGIGPATASLLLNVHDPQHALFFSDEAFYWLCCGGKKAPIKYSTKEYLALQSEAQAVCERLGVSATDVEKVAYVLMKLDQPAAKVQEKPKAEAKKGAAVSAASGKVASAKRKPARSPDQAKDETSHEPLRRSKRRRD